MKTKFSTVLVLSVGLYAMLLPGCSRKTEVDGELQRAAAALQQPAPAQIPETVPGQPAPAPAPAPAQELNQAVTDYKSGNFEGTVSRLQNLRATPQMTPEQRIAVNDAIAAVMTDLSARAAKGDARAAEALKQYEQMQTRRR